MGHTCREQFQSPFVIYDTPPAWSQSTGSSLFKVAIWLLNALMASVDVIVCVLPPKYSKTVFKLQYLRVYSNRCLGDD